MNEIEKKTGKQSGVQYVIDLDGLQLDTNLFSIVSGSFNVHLHSNFVTYKHRSISYIVGNDIRQLSGIHRELFYNKCTTIYECIVDGIADIHT